MARSQFLQILLLITTIATAQPQILQCGIGEVLKPYNMTCTGYESRDIQFRKAGEDIIAQCTSSAVESLYPSKYATTVINHGDQKECILTILNVTAQSQGLYRCTYDINGNTSCDFKVYAQTQTLQCGIGEVMKPYNMTCTGYGSGYIQFRKAGEDLIAQCGSESVINPHPDKYTVTIINYSDRRECILTILNVTAQSQGLFNCAYGVNGGSPCDFKVYARPESVSCQEPHVENDKVHVVCAVRKVYPDFRCHFTVITNDSVYRTQETFHYSSTEGASGFYDGNCSLELTLQNLGFGSHVFKVIAYPNVTGQVSDMKYGSNSSSSLTIRFPSAELKPSPDGYVLEGSTIYFTCRDINNPVLSNIYIRNGSQLLNTGYGYTTYSVIAHRGMGDITCQSSLLNMTSAPVTAKPQVAFKPTIVSFQANGDQSNVTIRNNSLLEFSCQAEGNPSPRLSISKDQVEKWTYSNSTQKFGLKLIKKIMADCLDTGLYYCQAQQNQYVVGITVAVYVKCAQQLGHSTSQETVYTAQLNGTLSITVPVYGYPEPTALHLEGKKYTLASGEYQLGYTKQQPPFGDVSLEIYTVREEVFQNYSLFISSTEGFLIYNFEIVVTEMPPSGPGLNVGALVGGIVGGVLVIVIAVLIFITILKRKGIVGKSNIHGKESTQLSNLSDGYHTDVIKTRELGYVNTQFNHFSDTDKKVPMPHTADKTKEKVSDQQKDPSTFEYENCIPNLYDEIQVYENT